MRRSFQLLGIGNGPKKPCLGVYGNVSRASRKNREIAIPEYTETQMEGPNPVSFIRKLPEALQDVDMRSIKLDTDQTQSLTKMEMAQMPVAMIEPELMGLPEQLLDFLDRKGIDRLTPVQSKVLKFMHGYKDTAICAPTGSGKTWGICLGLVARLMREGPILPFQTLFLTPSDELCCQIESWIKEMWWRKDDSSLVFAALSNHSIETLQARLEHRDYANPFDANISTAPGIVVSTAPVMYRYFEQRSEALKFSGRCSTGGGGIRDTTNFPIFCNLDTFVCDEVDSVLPPLEPDAPGNIMLNEIVRGFGHQAPLHVIMNSATLSSATIKHVKRFMRRSSLETSAVRIFDDEVREVRKSEEHSGRLPRHIVCPDSIQHSFYIANTVEEQLAATANAITDSVGPGSAREGQRDPVRALLIVPEAADLSAFRDLLSKLESEPLVQTTDDVRPVGELLTEMDGEGQAVVDATVTMEMDRDYFLVCPDNAVRGMNFDLTHVISYAQPKTMLEYVHWAGRVGRIGATGNSVVVMPRHFVRNMSRMCETLGIKFKLNRRKYADCHVPVVNAVA